MYVRVGRSCVDSKDGRGGESMGLGGGDSTKGRRKTAEEAFGRRHEL